MFNFSNNNGKLIALSGKARHGKDTFTNILIEEYKKHHNFHCFKISFADAIKQIGQKMFPTISQDDLWGESINRSKPLYLFDKSVVKDNKALEIRNVLLDIGKFGRSYDEDLWGLITLHTANELFNKYKFCNVIITDCRRKNEMNLIKAAGGSVIRIHRPNVEYVVDDISETDLDDVSIETFDKYIVNESIDSLKLNAKEVIDKFMLKANVKTVNG